MQMFGIGILELLVIMMLTVIVVGPDRMPQVAADLARWIRQGRAYARFMMRDFNQVVGELQKEANVSQEDWKEIANVVSRNTGEIGKELQRVVKDAEEAGDLAATKAAPAANGNGGNGANGSNGTAKATPEAEEPVAESAAADDETPAEEKPWYEPQKTPRASRRRSRE